jgi:hypothetical protein
MRGGIASRETPHSLIEHAVEAVDCAVKPSRSKQRALGGKKKARCRN